MTNETAALNKYLVWPKSFEFDESEGIEVQAFDAESAVPIWAKKFDLAGCFNGILRGQSARVAVRDLRNGDIEEFTVTAEAEVRYCAHRYPVQPENSPRG